MDDDLWVAGDVVVRYDRIFELNAYDPGAQTAPGSSGVGRPFEPKRRRGSYSDFSSSTSISISTFLPSIMPPVSRAAFHVMSHASRSIVGLRGEPEHRVALHVHAHPRELALRA